MAGAASAAAEAATRERRGAAVRMDARRDAGAARDAVIVGAEATAAMVRAEEALGLGLRAIG